MNGLQAIAVLIIRLWAAGAIFGSTVDLALLVGHNLEEIIARRFFSYAAIGSMVWIFLGVTVWFLARRLAKLALPKTPEGNIAISIGATEFVMIGSFLIGGFYLVKYISMFAAKLIRITYQIGSDAPFGPVKIDPQTLQSLIGDLAILAIALVLTFRPREIAEMFAALRVAGLSKVDEK